MNGPQWTACLAKGYKNDKYKWIEVLVTSRTRLRTDGQTQRQCQMLSLARFTEPLPDNN